jgi:RNA polymerase sigma-70 factor (ECF subfamily)
VSATAEAVLETVVREEWRRLTSLLLAQYRRLDLVEDALGDAVEAAARRWPEAGPPDNPAAWLLTTARRRVLDRLRAESMAHRKVVLLVTDAARQEGRAMADPGDLVEDDVLRLVLMCTHPALAPEAASALALRLVLGVSTHDIARLFLVGEPTVAARITRAKKKIVAAGIPFAVPDHQREEEDRRGRDPLRRPALGRAAAPAGVGRPDRLPGLHRRLRPGERPGPPARRPGR